MEKANLEPKTWTMQGEVKKHPISIQKLLQICGFAYIFIFQVTAAKRPKNSALEVDLDFEHNMRPAPVITEEVTASLEDLIKKRILEVIIYMLNFSSPIYMPDEIRITNLTIIFQAHFDDVQKPPHLPSNVRRELKELVKLVMSKEMVGQHLNVVSWNKFFLFYRTKIKARRALVKFMRCFSLSLEDKHSLHNMILHCVSIFFIQEEYTEKTGLASAPPSHADEQKEVLAYELVETLQHAKISCKHYQLIQALSLLT